MKRFATYLMPLALLSLVVLVYPKSAEAFLDQSNYTGGTFIGFGQAAALKYSCQGFKPTASPVTAVSFYMNNGVAGQGRLLWIDNADANSFPTGALEAGLGTTELTNAMILAGNAKTSKYFLTNPIKVTVGAQYVYCLAPWNTSTHVYADDYSDYNSSVTNPYPNGKMANYDCSVSCAWSNNDSGNGDRVFEVWTGVISSIVSQRTGTATLTTGTVTMTQ